MANGKPLLKEKDKKKRTKSVSKLKKELDKVFSLYIRHKYAKNGKVQCYTCGIVKDIKEMQCGHFCSRSYLSTRFDERNARPQCIGCNIYGNGRVAKFATNLERDYGIGTTTELFKRAQEIVKNFPYQEKIDYYKAKLKEYEQ